VSGAVLLVPPYAFMRCTETALSLPHVTIAVDQKYRKTQPLKHGEAIVRFSCRVRD